MGNICSSMCNSKDDDNQGSQGASQDKKNSQNQDTKLRMDLPEEHPIGTTTPRKHHHLPKDLTSIPNSSKKIPKKSKNTRNSKSKSGSKSKIRDHETGSTNQKRTSGHGIENGSTGHSSPQANHLQYSSSKNKGRKMSTSDFDFLKYLGKGTFGKVALVKKKNTGSYYAMKILKKKDFNVTNSVENAVTEKEVLMKSHHPFVVKLRYSFQDKTSLYFVMDYIPGGDLMSLLIKFGIFQEELAQ